MKKENKNIKINTFSKLIFLILLNFNRNNQKI